MSAPPSKDPHSMRLLFNAIAERYDLANSLMSFHAHALWNRVLVRTILSGRCARLLDLCSGTGDIAFRLLRSAKQPPHITLSDISENMLAIAQRRATRLAPCLQSQLAFCQADAHALPFDTGAFDTVSIAYGIRNLCDLARALHQIWHVLAPGGRLLILELTRPQGPILARLHAAYLRTALPLIGAAITRKREAYTYLPESIHHFLAPSELTRALHEARFTACKVRPLFGGIATLLTAEKAAHCIPCCHV